MNPYLLDRLPTDRGFSWVLTVDPNKRHGGLLTAVDHLENWFVVGEHYAEGLPDSRHAAAYRDLLAAFSLSQNRDVAVYADPGGAGAQAIINMAEVGLYAQPVKKDAGSVKASIERIRRQAWINPAHRHPLTGALGAPRIYFLTSLRSEWELNGVQYRESRLLWELRQYRQKPNGLPDQPVKEKDDLVDCLRYLALVRPYAAAPEDTTAQQERAKLDALSQKASAEYDKAVAKALQPKQQGFWIW